MRRNGGGVIGKVLFVLVVFFVLLMWLGRSSTPRSPSPPPMARQQPAPSPMPAPAPPVQVPAAAVQAPPKQIAALASARENLRVATADASRARDDALNGSAEYQAALRAANEAEARAKSTTSTDPEFKLKLAREWTAAQDREDQLKQKLLRSPAIVAADAKVVAAHQAMTSAEAQQKEDDRRSEEAAAAAAQREWDRQHPEEVAQRDREQRIRSAPVWSAEGVVEHYQANELKADADLKGRYLKVSGVVSAVSRDLLDKPYVIIAGPQSSFRSVQCLFTEHDVSQLTALQKGKQVTIYGKCDGLMANVLFSDCTVTN